MSVLQTDDNIIETITCEHNREHNAPKIQHISISSQPNNLRVLRHQRSNTDMRPAQVTKIQKHSLRILHLSTWYLHPYTRYLRLWSEDHELGSRCGGVLGHDRFQGTGSLEVPECWYIDVVHHCLDPEAGHH